MTERSEWPPVPLSRNLTDDQLDDLAAELVRRAFPENTGRDTTTDHDTTAT